MYTTSHRSSAKGARALVPYKQLSEGGGGFCVPVHHVNVNVMVGVNGLIVYRGDPALGKGWTWRETHGVNAHIKWDEWVTSASNGV